MKRLLLSLFLLPLAATAHAQTILYWGGGSSDIADGTPLNYSNPNNAELSGTWNETLENWATSPSGATYQAWEDGAIASLGILRSSGTPNHAILTLESDFTLGGLVGFHASSSGFSQVFQLTASSARTLDLSGTIYSMGIGNTRGISLLPNVSLVGSSAITKEGPVKFEILSNSNAYTGPITIRNGPFAITSGGSLNGVTEFNLRGYPTSALSSAYSSDFTSPSLSFSGIAGANDKIHDEAVVNLTRGTFRYDSASTSTETMGELAIQTHGVLNLANGTAGGVLTITDGITRGPSGLGTLTVETTGSEGPRAGVQLGNLNGQATDVVLPWMATVRAEFMMIDSANNNQLTRVVSTDAPTDLSTWVAGSNYRVGGYNGPFTGATNTIGNLSINSLGFYVNNSATPSPITIGDGNTLTIASGGIAFTPAGGNVSITGGSLTSGINKLYVLTGSSTASGGITISSRITGALDLVKAGTTTLTIGGTVSNDYTGTTYVNHGAITFNKTGVGVIAVPGDLVIRTGASAALQGSNPLSATSNVLIESDGLLSFGSAAPVSGIVTNNGGTISFPNHSPVFNNAGTGLAFNGGYFVQNSSVTGTLNLQTNVSYADTSTKQARWERYGNGAFNIELDGAERTFDIADSDTLDADLAEMVVDTAITNGTGTGSLLKTGAGTLQLTGTNLYTGATTIDEGTVQVSRIVGTEQSGLTGILEGNAITFDEPIANQFVVGQVVSGTGIATPRTITRVINEYVVTLNSTTSTGLSEEINIGAVTRTGSLAGDVIVNNTGTFLIDSEITVGNAVTVNTGGSLINNGVYNGALILGAGTLGGSGTYDIAVTMIEDSILAPGNSPGVATFSTGLTMETGSSFEFELIADTTAGRGSNYDGVDVTGGLFTLESDVLFDLVFNSAESTVDFTDSFWDINQSWLVVENTNAPSIDDLFTLGSISNDSLNQNFAITGGEFGFTQVGNDVYLNYTIPEPSAMALLLMSITAGLMLRRSRRNN